MLKYLPVFYRKTTEPTGKSVGPFVYLPEGTSIDDPLAAHERWHVKQFYFMAILWIVTYGSLAALFVTASTMLFALATLLLNAYLLSLIWSKDAKLNRECAAYGESVRVSLEKHGRRPSATVPVYAKFLTSQMYDFNITQEEAEKRILDYAGSYKLM